jgi:hypothetical protein
MTNIRTIKLSGLDIAYLTNTQFLPDDLSRLVCAANSGDGDARLLEVDGATAEVFRDEFTARLAKVGFDQNYEPTREGKLLEDLIDRFGADK